MLHRTGIRVTRALGMALLLPAMLMMSSCGKSGGGGVAGPTPPAAPTNLVVTPGDAQNAVSWSSVSGATSYNLYWKVGSGATTADNKMSNVTSGMVHSGLTNGTLYSYVVTAVGAGGESGASSQASGTPTAAAPTIPAAPTGVGISAGDAANTITWSLTAGATSYNLYWKVGSGASKLDTKISNVTSPYTHQPITNGTLYSYVVTAQNIAGESVESASVSATPVATPVYVSSSTGNDANGGTQALPVRTLSRAYTIAAASGKTLILMEAGAYKFK